jgi:maleate isomerase
VAGRIEDELGIPVVTSNQALVWRALRLAGCQLPVPGHGRLLQS